MPREREVSPPLATERHKGPPAAAPGPASPQPRELEGSVLARAAAGEPAAQRALVLLYQVRVLAFCTRMLGDRTRAEDAAQECFLRVLPALARFDARGPARLSTWILTIATRLCIDEIRRTRRPHVPLDDQLPTQDLSEPAALESALRRRLEAAICALPDDMRATFVLRVTAERSVEETARVLGIDEGTVKSRLSRARALLRESIGEV